MLTPSPLLFENDDNEDELMRAIRESREAYRDHIQRLEADRARRRQLAETLALPISRLRLVLSSTRDPREIGILHQILDHAMWNTRPNEADDQSPPRLALSPEMKTYLERLGRVFAPLVDALFTVSGTGADRG